MMSEEKRALYILVDQMLVGNKKYCKEAFESTVNGRKEHNPADQERAVIMVRYALEYYLEWSSEQIRCNIDEEILRQLKLDGIIRQRIEFPIELEPMENLQYLVHLMYPERYSYNKKQAILTYYDRILSGEINRFKKGFFTTKDGKERAVICFNRMLSMIGPFANIRQVYDLFASCEGRKILSKYKLNCAARDIFEFPIDYLHFSIPEYDQDEMYYQQLRFKIINEKQKRSYRRRGEFIA